MPLSNADVAGACAGLPLSSGLTDTEIKAACDLARSSWDRDGATGGIGGGAWFASLDLAGLRVPTTLAPCVWDAARRVNLAANQGTDNSARALDVFVGGALRLAIQAVANPSAAETLRLQEAGLA